MYFKRNHVDVIWALSRGLDYIIKTPFQKGVVLLTNQQR